MGAAFPFGCAFARTSGEETVTYAETVKRALVARLLADADTADARGDHSHAEDLSAIAEDVNLRTGATLPAVQRGADLVPMETGCWIDGHWGQYGPDRLAEICDELTGSDFAEGMARLRAIGEESEGDRSALAWQEHSEMCDEIEAALNARTYGGSWSWYDGGGFYLTARCEECGGATAPADEIDFGEEPCECER